jgi:hypothetical protein
MGMQVFPNFDNGSTRGGLHVVAGREFTEHLPLELPRYLTESIPDEPDGLGCIRGIAMAIGFQAFIVLVIFGFWRFTH